VSFFALGVVAALLFSGRSFQTQATRTTTLTFDYKVELLKHKEDLEGRLKEDGRSGWRLQSFVASPADNQFVLILEKANTP
jgi:hypothetical protein